MERLQKVLAHAGIASRRKAEEMILAGQISVNGEVVDTLGTKVSDRDKIAVNGVPITEEDKVYYVFNKPRRVISAVSDDKGRAVVTDYFPTVPERIYPIGRLDYDTSGVLLMTNDGEFANQLMHPKFEINKTYIATLEGVPSKARLDELATGVELDGRTTAPAEVEMISYDRAAKRSIVSLTIHEGMNHQVKRMFEVIGSPVKKLKRISYGDISLKGISTGEWREMTKNEINAFKKERNR